MKGRKLLQEEKGSTAVEYVILVAAAGLLLVGVTVLFNALTTFFGSWATYFGG